MSRSKQKGTGGEREVLRAAEEWGLTARRTAASSRFDIEVFGADGATVQALATRPDRGRWLVSIPLGEFLSLLSATGSPAQIECKRYAKFAHHSIFEEKFGR